MAIKRSVIITSFLFVSWFFLAGAYAWADKIEDWKKLDSFQQSFTPYLSESSATHDDQFVTGWTEWRKAFAPFAQEFTSEYGATREELMRSFEGIDAPEGIYVYPQNLVDILTLDSDAHQKKIAGWLQKDADEVFARWEAMKGPSPEKMELKADYAQRALTKYTQARQLNPDLGKDAVSKAQKALEESKSAHRKIMQDLKWPGHNPDFNGSGDPDTLADAALKLLRDMKVDGKQWSKPEYDDEHIPVAACVTGNRWEVYKKAPITEQPTQYSLQFLVAFEGKKDPEIAYAYTMYFYTDEKAGVKMEPPFYYCNSGQYAKYKMRMENLPAGGGKSTSSGAAGVLFRLILSFLLIGGGIAAWNEFLRARFSKISGVIDMLWGKKQALGVALLIVGILALLRTFLFLFSPLADILPQFAALALGISLVSVRRLAEIIGNAKAATVLARLRPLDEALTPHQVTLGKISLALGLIHLAIGGVALF